MSHSLGQYRTSRSGDPTSLSSRNVPRRPAGTKAFLSTGHTVGRHSLSRYPRGIAYASPGHGVGRSAGQYRTQRAARNQMQNSTVCTGAAAVCL
eukprot:2763702-Rhodomonas_salina.1